LKRIIAGKAEHMADAVATIEAGLQSKWINHVLSAASQKDIA